MLSLKVEARTPEKKTSLVRKEGRVPAVCYGPKYPSVAFSVAQGDFAKIWKNAGESTVVVLETPSGKVNTLIHEVQLDPVKHIPMHVDFYAVEAGKEVEVHVPLVFEGVAPAVKELGGILVKVLHEIEVKATPDKLPHEIVVDVSVLTGLQDQILIKDIKLPSGVHAVTHETEVVASIAQAVEEKEEEAAPVDLSAIEVEKKGKKEEEEGAAA